MSILYHQHSGGNHPHVHHNDAAGKSYHHECENESHYSSGHGDHAYDVDGNEAAIVASDPHRLVHWHFDCPFESVAIAQGREFGNDLTVTVFAVVNHDL